MADIINIESYSQLKNYFGGYPNSSHCTYFYRGINSNHSLLPSLCYDKLPRKKLYIEFEKGLLQEFSNFLNKKYKKSSINDWNTWFVSRHFSLKSRLIDFSKDITIALQFAFEASNNCDAHLWAFDTSHLEIVSSKDLNSSPFETKNHFFINPALNLSAKLKTKIAFDLMFIQSGKFLILPINKITTPIKEEFSENLICFRISNSNFNSIRKEIEEENGTLMDKDLLILKKHILRKKCDRINIKKLKKTLRFNRSPNNNWAHMYKNLIRKYI